MKIFGIPGILICCLAIGTFLLGSNLTAPAQTLHPVEVTERVEEVSMDTFYPSRFRHFPASTAEMPHSGSRVLLEISLKQGLPAQEIWTVVTDEYGFVWLGTRRSGLLRYDGKSLLQISTLEGLPSNSVRVVYPVGSGRIWLGTDGGMALLDRDRLISFSFKNPALARTQFLFRGPDGSIWGGSGPISRWDGQQMKSYSSVELIGNNVWAAVDAEGKSWFCSQNGVLIRENGKFYSPELPASYQGRPVQACNADSEGRIYLSFTHSVLEWDGKSFREIFYPPGGTVINYVWKVIDLPGLPKLFFFRDRGVYVDQGGWLIPYAQLAELMGHWPTDAFQDHAGNTWIATYGQGLRILKPDVVGQIAFPGSVIRFPVAELKNLGNGQIVVSNGSEIFLLDGVFLHRTHQIDPYFDILAVGGNHPDSLLVGSNLTGYIVYSGPGKGYYLGPDSAWAVRQGLIPYIIDPELSYVPMIRPGRKGNIWINCPPELHCWNRDTLRIVYTSSGKCANYPGTECHETNLTAIGYALEEDSAGGLWVGTTDGLYYFKGDSVRQIPLSRNKVQPYILDMIGSADSILWIATMDQGLFGYSKDSIFHYTADDGLPYNEIGSMQLDNRGRLWLGLPGTIALMDRGASRVEFHLLQSMYGVPASNFLGNKAATDGNGHLYWGTPQGIVHHNAAGLNPNRYQPAVFLEEVRLFLAPLKASPGDRLWDGHPVLVPLPFDPHLGYRQNQLSFSFIGIDWKDPENLRYQYRLLGSDTTWSNPSHETSVTFLKLAPGDYEFQVRALAGHGSRGEIISYPFHILAPLWQRSWFLVLNGLLLLCGIFLVLRRRNQSFRQRERRLEAQVRERTRGLAESLAEKDILLKEIHHRVKNNLQLIASLLNLQGAASQDEGVQAITQEGQRKVEAIALIHQMLYQSKDLGAVNFAEYAEQLCVAIYHFYQQPGQEIRFSIEGNGHTLDLDTAIPLGLILNELVTNAFKYAFARRKEGTLSIQLLQPETGNYQLTVADDGPGFPEGFGSSGENSLGLRLTMILARQLDGELNWENREGACLRIDFKDTLTRKKSE